jgi:tetratricopeptide (TPR) repeat protein
MSAFASGVTFLSAEEYALAVECFDRVVKEFPACYEGWVNRGYAYLMLYCDGLSQRDLRDYAVGQVMCGGFYQRIKSLQPAARGPDPKKWFEAVGSFRKALALKPNLALAKAHLGLAYLFHPEGTPKVAEATELLEEANEAVANDKTLDPLNRATLLVNLGVARLAGGSRKDGVQKLDQAAAIAQRLPVGEAAVVDSAVLYNRALLRAGADDPGERKQAVQLLEKYLRTSEDLSAWWPVAYDRYVKLCKEAGVPAKEKRTLLQASAYLLRPPVGLDLPGGQKITLGEALDDVLKRLGPGKETEVVGQGLKRLRFEKQAVEILATDQVLAILLSSPQSPALPMRARGVGGQVQFELKVGLPRKTVHAKMGQNLHSRKLLEAGPEYSYYRQLGVAIRYDRPFPEGNIIELVLARIPAPEDGK